MVGALPEEFFAFAEEVNKGPKRVLSQLSILRWPIWRRKKPLKMKTAVHTVRAEIHPPKREGSPRVAAVLTGIRGFDS
jgi:hypothetical protein